MSTDGSINAWRSSVSLTGVLQTENVGRWILRAEPRDLFTVVVDAKNFFVLANRWIGERKANGTNGFRGTDPVDHTSRRISVYLVAEALICLAEAKVLLRRLNTYLIRKNSQPGSPGEPGRR